MHSLLSPSSAHIWKHCAAYPTMVRKYPGEESEEAKEGTAAHSVFHLMFDGITVEEGSQLSSSGAIITQEMIDGAELLLGTMLSISSKESWNIEQTTDVFDDLQCFGTPDAWSYNETTNTLTVVDYKFGHRFVEEFENDQCVLYTKGIIDMLDVDDQTLNVDIVIVQPRCYYRGEPVRTWHLTGSDIRGQINMLRMAGERALDVDPQATTNPGCGDCSARHDCPALQKATYADVETSTCSTPINITAQAAAIELKMLERAQQRMQARIDGLSTFVLSQIRSGQRVPHYQAMQGYGNRKWLLDDETVISVGDAFGKDLRKTGVITPSQAIKLGIDEAVIKEYSVIPMGELKLAPSTDPRKLFSGVK